jgi:hypothetical protein
MGSDAGAASSSIDGSGVLAGLPRTRPQRLSARRVAARARTPRETTARAVPRKAATGAARAAKKPRKAPKSSLRAASGREPAPRQGFEAEPDDSLDGPVAPPGGAELVASAAELAGELAKTGVGAGVRLVRDLLSRLPG